MLAANVKKILNKIIGIKNKLLRASWRKPNLFTITIVSKNSNIIIGTGVRGKNIIFNVSEKLLNNVLTVKRRQHKNKIPIKTFNHLPPKYLAISKISKPRKIF